LLQEQGNVVAAAPMLERALMIRAQTLGSDHPATHQVHAHLEEARHVLDPGNTTE
jgi:hypothetical protein